MQYGVPNSRPRYYLLASRNPQFQPASLSKEPPISGSIDPEPICGYLETTPSLISFLELKTLQKYGKAIDVVTRNSKRSACFTKSYGSYISGCGSYFCENEDLVDGQHLADEALTRLSDVKVRKLTPREVSLLLLPI